MSPGAQSTIYVVDFGARKGRSLSLMVFALPPPTTDRPNKKKTKMQAESIPTSVWTGCTSREDYKADESSMELGMDGAESAFEVHRKRRPSAACIVVWAQEAFHLIIVLLRLVCSSPCPYHLLSSLRTACKSSATSQTSCKPLHRTPAVGALASSPLVSTADQRRKLTVSTK